MTRTKIRSSKQLFIDNNLDLDNNKVSNLADGEDLTDGVNVKQLNDAKDKTFTFSQSFPARAWQIDHNLEKKPSVSVTDSTGVLVDCEIIYYDLNTVLLTFSNPFAGIADLN